MKKISYHLLFVVVVGLVAYSNTFSVPFQFDDVGNIVDNPVIHQLDNFISSSKGYEFNPRRYIGYLTFALNYHFGGLDVIGYHVVNLAIHITNALLVYFLVLLTFRTPYFIKAGYGQEAIGEGGQQNQAGREQQQAAKGERQREDRVQSSKFYVQNPEDEGQKPEEESKQYEVGRRQCEEKDEAKPENGSKQAGEERRQSAAYSQVPGAYSLFIPLAAALLFVAHPLQTQAVTYIVQRFTSLATMFYLLALVLYIRGRLSSRPAGKLASDNPPASPLMLRGEQRGVTPQPRGEVKGGGSPLTSRLLPLAPRLSPIAYYSFSLLFAVCAMKTKEIAFTLPVIVVLFEFLFFHSSLKKRLLVLLPALATLLIIPLGIVGTHIPLQEILSDLSERTRVQTNIPRVDYLLTQMRVVTTYIRLIFLPVNQNLDYDFPVYRSLFTPSVFASLVFLAAIFGIAMWLLYKSRQGAIGYGQGQIKENKVQSPEEEGIAHRAKRIELQQEESRQNAGSREQQEDSLQTGTRTSLQAGEDERGDGSGSAVASDLSPIACERLIAFGILWFFITLAVESSVIPIADVIFEHRAYLPSVGAGIAIASGALLFFERFAAKNWRTPSPKPSPSREEVTPPPSAPPLKIRGGRGSYEPGGDEGEGVGYSRFTIHDSRFTKFALVVFGLIILMLATATYARNRVWKDKIGLWEDVVRKSPSLARGHNNLGIAYKESGSIEKAIEQYRIASQLNPDLPRVHVNLGMAYFTKGWIDAAIEQFQTAIGVAHSREDLADSHHNLGLAYVKRGMTAEAIAEFEAALKFGADPGVYSDMGVVYKQRGATERAVECYKTAIAIKRDYAPAYFNLGMLYREQGMERTASAYLRRAHELDPSQF